MAPRDSEAHTKIDDDDLAGLTWGQALEMGSAAPRGAYAGPPRRWLSPALERRIRAATATDDRAALLAAIDYFEVRASRHINSSAMMFSFVAIAISVIAMMLTSVPEPSDLLRRATLITLAVYTTTTALLFVLDRLRVLGERRAICVAAKARRALADAVRSPT